MFALCRVCPCARSFNVGQGNCLEGRAEVFVGEADSTQLRGCLALAQPRAALALRVHQHWGARRARDQDAVLHAQVVCRQPLPPMQGQVVACV